MSYKEHQADLLWLRKRYGSVLNIRSSLQEEVVRREQAHGADSIETEAAVDFLIDYEEINAKAIRGAIARAKAIDQDIARLPVRHLSKRLSEEDFEV